MGIAVVLDHLDRDLAADRRDLALEVAHAGLARVVADDAEQRLVGELDILLFEPVGLALLADQVLLRDLELLRLRVAREPDDLHAILQAAAESVRACSRS